MSANYNIQYDEQGSPFTQIGGTGKRAYISPVAMGTGTRPTDGGGIYRTDYRWDQNKRDWTRGVDWGNVMTTGIGAIAGGAALAPLFSGGGAVAGGGALTEAAIPTSIGIPGGALPGVGVSAAKAGSGLTGKVLGASRVLGGMAESGAASKRNEAATNLQRDYIDQNAYKTDLEAPGIRLNQSTAAAKIANGKPVKANWGGPGSGLRGETLKFEGGYSDPNLFDGDIKALANNIMMQNMRDQLSGKKAPTARPNPKSGIMDKIISGAAAGTSLWGAMR